MELLYQKEMDQFVRALCENAGENEEFYNRFSKKLKSSPEIYNELLYYLANQNFLCQKKIENVTVVDIMIYQIDHFKAEMDMGYTEMKENGDRMLLMAFNTFLDMEKNPEEILEKLKTETGTDYPGKF